MAIKRVKFYKFLEKFNATKPDIFIVDGFAIKEDSELKDGSNVVFIRRGVMPEREVFTLDDRFTKTALS